MAKTKLDRVLELLEAQASNMQGTVDMTNTSESVAQVPSTIENTVSETVEQETDNNQNEVDEVLEQNESDSFEKSFNELASMFSTQQPQVVEEESVSVDSSNIEMENYKKLYEQEIEKRIALESEARQTATEVAYLKNMLDKEWEKYYSNIDKQKELEAELRIANASKMPEQISPLWQSYLLWQETNTPAHKRRAVRDALTLVENMTWISANDYYWTIIKAENKDIPDISDKSSYTSTVDVNSKWWIIGGMSL